MKLTWYCKGNWVGVVADDWKDMAPFILLSFSCSNLWGNDAGEKNWLSCNLWLFPYCMFWWKSCSVDNVDHPGGFNASKSCRCRSCSAASGLYASFGLCVVLRTPHSGSGEKLSTSDSESSLAPISDWGLLPSPVSMCRVLALALSVEDDCISK